MLKKIFLLLTTFIYLYAESDLINAIKNKNIDAASQLIKSGYDLELKDKYGQTALFHAVNAKSLKLVQLLVNKGANINIKDAGDQTALMWATYGMVSQKNIIAFKGPLDDVKNTTNNIKIDFTVHIDQVPGTNGSGDVNPNIDIDVGQYLSLSKEAEDEIEMKKEMKSFLESLEIAMYLVDKNAEIIVPSSDSEYLSFVDKSESQKIMRRLKSHSKSDLAYKK